MDVKNNNKVDDIIASAQKAFNEGNFKTVIAMLEPLLKGEKKKTLSPSQERRVVDLLSSAFGRLGDYKSALPHAKRGLELNIQVCGKGSEGPAYALRALGAVETGLKEFKSARKRFNDAMAIYKELGMEKSLHYGSLLLSLAEVDFAQQRWKEALEGYIKAKVVMDDFKEHTTYGVIVGSMAICYRNLNQLTEALQFYREAVQLARNTVGDQHPEYAIRIYNLADAYVCIKQPTIAIPLIEDALAICKRGFGDKHPLTIDIINNLAAVRDLEKKGRHAVSNPGDVRMCNNCEKVSKEIHLQCDACKSVNYCNKECQLAHWPVHQPALVILVAKHVSCLLCRKVLQRNLSSKG